MKLEDQVCDLIQAKRLKELGVKQDSLFCFYDGGFLKDLWGTIQTNEWRESKSVSETTFSAFTVAELGVMLQYIGVYTAVNTVMGGWGVHHVNDYKEYELPQPGNFNNEKYEAHARAHILIHLLENNLVKVEEVNQYLK